METSSVATGISFNSELWLYFVLVPMLSSQCYLNGMGILAICAAIKNHTLHKNIHTHHLGIYWVCRWKRIKLS